MKKYICTLILFKSWVLGKTKLSAQWIFTLKIFAQVKSSVVSDHSHEHDWENLVPGKSLAITSLGNFNLKHVMNIIANYDYGTEYNSNPKLQLKPVINEKMWHSTFLICIVHPHHHHIIPRHHLFNQND